MISPCIGLVVNSSMHPRQEKNPSSSTGKIMNWIMPYTEKVTPVERLLFADKYLNAYRGSSFVLHAETNLRVAVKCLTQDGRISLWCISMHTQTFHIKVGAFCQLISYNHALKTKLFSFQSKVCSPTMFTFCWLWDNGLPGGITICVYSP